MSVGHTRGCSVTTSTNRIEFYLTSPTGRFYSKGYSTVINLVQMKITSQDDGTNASKYMSRIINSTLKHGGWITIRVHAEGSHGSFRGMGNYIHFFRIGNETYCNAFKIKGYTTGPIFLGLISTLGIKTQKEVDRYVEKCMNSVPEVLACLTNNLKYNFYYEGSHETSLLKIDTISDTEVAIQLYEGCWIPMKQTTFRTLYSAGTGRVNKFTSISPEELHFICTKEHLTIVQIKLMYAYLLQNTSSKLVTERSLELLNDLPKMFPNRIKKFLINKSADENIVIMVVSGNSLVWAITGVIRKGRNITSGRQNVSSYQCISLKNFDIAWGNNRVEFDSFKTLKRCLRRAGEEGVNFITNDDETTGINTFNYRERNRNNLYYDEETGEAFLLTGSICIDQRNSDVSLGDQFASRAMAMLNDTASFERVSTMRTYKSRKIAKRVDLNALSKLQFHTSKK